MTSKVAATQDADRRQEEELDPIDLKVDFSIDGDDDEDDPIGLIRERLVIGGEISDVTIAASMAAIASKTDDRARWLAAFGSPLGRWLALRGTDLNNALTLLIANAPKPS